MNLVLSTLVMALTAGTTIAPLSGVASEVGGSEFQIAQSNQAESTCRAAASDRGLRVREVLDVNSYEGGSEVVMRVNRRNENFVVGCDYADGTRQVQLYRMENSGFEDDGFDDSDDSNNWNNYPSGVSSIRNSNDAETVAREEVGRQLGIEDPYSDVVDIRDIEQNGRSWQVEGAANGAPFVIRMRANDAEVTDFQLY